MQTPKPRAAKSRAAAAKKSRAATAAKTAKKKSRAAKAAGPKPARVIGKGRRPVTGRPSGRRPGGMNVTPNEMYRYHLGRAHKRVRFAFWDDWGGGTTAVSHRYTAYTACPLTPG